MPSKRDYLDKAIECATAAENSTLADVRARYLKLAETYRKLAHAEGALASLDPAE